jgi:hypothetical protein
MPPELGLRTSWAQDDILSELLRQEAGRPSDGWCDAHYRLPIDFLEAVNGTSKARHTTDGTDTDVAVPAGVKDGQVLRPARAGVSGGPGGGRSGDCSSSSSRSGRIAFFRQGRRRHSPRPANLARGGGVGGKVRGANTHGSCEDVDPQSYQIGQGHAPARERRSPPGWVSGRHVCSAPGRLAGE